MLNPSQRLRQPIALTIAGSDSGGGAGLQADLKTFAALGVHGTTVVTCVTAQNPTGVTGVHSMPSRLVEQQLAAVFAELPPRAAKTGMLFNAEIIRSVAAFWRALPSGAPGSQRRPALVIDPVMVATSGAALLRPSALRALKEQLFPCATLLTPNLDEMAALLSVPVAALNTVGELRRAARELHARFGVPILAKGGHLTGLHTAIDFFWDGREELLLTAPFVRGVATHGTGCTYAAAVTGYLALGCRLGHAVQLAKEHVTQAIAQSVRVGRHTVLNAWWR